MIRKNYIVLIAVLVFGLGSWALGQTDRDKTAYLTLTSPTQVGTVTLPAGNYEVNHRLSPTGHYAEFARITESDLGFEGSPTFEESEIVARVDCTMQPLTATVKKSAVVKEGSRIARLEIRGENVVHNF